MFTLILTVFLGYPMTVSVPNFQTLQLCEAAATDHRNRLLAYAERERIIHKAFYEKYTSKGPNRHDEFAKQHNPGTVVTSCVQTQVK
jgi:hypothetical protein